MNKTYQAFHIRKLICGHVLAAAVFCALILSNRASAQEDVPVPVCSDRQFDLEVAAILDTYDEPVTKAQAAREPFLSSRLILKSDDITVDPYLLGAAEAVQDMDGHYIIQFNSPEEAEQAARSLEQDPGTIYVEPDRYLFTSDEGGDTGGDSSGSCWGTEFVGAADYVQYLNEGGAASADPIRIAVVDSGVRKTHELLSGLIDSQYEKDFVDNDDDASDTYSHGTFVAGIIAQCVKDLGNIRIVPVRVMSGKGVETTAFVRGIRHIAGKVNYTNGTSGYRKRADVMNLSIVSTAASTSQYLTEYIANAARSGCTVVIAAGNSGGDASNYPPANITDAQSPGTIIVSSCSQSGEPVVNFATGPGSNYGDTVDISAPGVDLTSCDLTSDTAYRSGSGTSYSAPYVSAAAALVMAAYPSATPAQIESVLTESAAQLNNSTGRWYGSGILNLRALIPGNGEDTQADQEAAQAVTDLIDALPSVITLDDRPDVEAARSAYNGLTAKQKLLVTNLALLEGAEKKIRDLDAAGAVMALIDQIPDPVTVEDAEAIENARAAYDALTDDQKALVDHYDRLTESEAALQTALEEKAQADQAAADEVNALISGLPEPVTPEDEEAVTEARAAYNALTDDQKLLVTDYSVLEQAEKTIADHKAAGAVAALIALIPDP
ncbi:MAG: S8 family serine peptidase, partial [Lachnospiraceae bacterium]|nr:S8 family serine peptidase [Lachnospiraceae bacterium]